MSWICPRHPSGSACRLWHPSDDPSGPSVPPWNAPELISAIWTFHRETRCRVSHLFHGGTSRYVASPRTHRIMGATTTHRQGNRSPLHRRGPVLGVPHLDRVNEHLR